MRIDAPYIIRIDSLQNTMTWFYFLLNLEQVKVFDSDTTSDDCLGERDVDLDLQVVLSICFRWCVCAGGFIAPGFAELMDLRYLYVAHSHLLRDRVSNSLSHTHTVTPRIWVALRKGRNLLPSILSRMARSSSSSAYFCYLATLAIEFFYTFIKTT